MLKPTVLTASAVALLAIAALGRAQAPFANVTPDMIRTSLPVEGAPLAEKGRPAAKKKKEPGETRAAPAGSPPRAPVESFEDLLDLSEEAIRGALAEKEGGPRPQSRAMTRYRVDLSGLTQEAALERLRRFLRASHARGDRVVTVAFGPDPEVRRSAEGYLASTADGLVEAVSAAREEGAAKVTLAP